MPEISEELKQTYIETAKVLKGSERRQFMVRIVKSLGYGGQSYAAREFHWGRNTIAKGIRELESGEPIADNFFHSTGIGGMDLTPTEPLTFSSRSPTPLQIGEGKGKS